MEVAGLAVLAARAWSRWHCRGGSCTSSQGMGQVALQGKSKRDSLSPPSPALDSVQAQMKTLAAGHISNSFFAGKVDF